jgi:hypothetical protein
MMGGILFVGAVVLIAVAMVAMGIFKKKRREALRTAPVAGKRTYPGGTLDPQAWVVPRLKGFGAGGIVSAGMPEHPSLAYPGIYIDLPQPGQDLDALAFNPGPLTGKSRVRMKYRIEADPGVEFKAVSKMGPNPWTARITMFLQREGDDWSGAGEHADDRWYATFSAVPMEVGERELVVPFDGPWTSLTPDATPATFADALAHCHLLGPVFGGNEDSYGHGMFATGRARLTILEFVIE